MTSCGCGCHDAVFTRPFHEDEDPTLCRACFVQVLEDEFIALEEKMIKLRDAHRVHNTDWVGGQPPVPLMTTDERRLRRMFAHCYAGASLYCDDGELQDASERPTIDFLRDPIPFIRQNLRIRAHNQFKETPCDTSPSSSSPSSP